MLQQILRDMRVAPEILAELDDTQKQNLFCRMREEQVRRWRLWDQKLNQQEDADVKRKTSLTNNAAQKKTVNFLPGENGEPWVWIMGEHKNDKTIEQILEEEVQAKAHNQAILETEELRKSVEREFIVSGLMNFNNEEINTIEKNCISPKQSENIEDSMDIYCSVDELREKMKSMTPEIKSSESIVNNNTPTKTLDFTNNYQKSNNNQNNSNYKNNITNFNLIEGRRDILQEINPNKTHKVSARVALWERRVTEERACEILKNIRHHQAQALQEAEETARSQHLLWQEQEKKAKEAEIQIREIARRAREEHRRSSVVCDKSPSPASLDSTDICYTDPSVNLSEEVRPPSRDAIIQWFSKSELPRGAGLDENGKHAKWFHGLITRNEAESLLQDCSEGSYLVRVSERIWGYAISYRSAQRCKHYLVDASQDTHYQFLGANQVSHKTLADLLAYHSKTFITEVGKELLLRPCEVKGVPQIISVPVS